MTAAVIRVSKAVCSSGRCRKFSASCVLLLICLLASPGSPATLQYLDVDNDPDIQITTQLPGARRATSEQDLETIIRDNLDADLRPWRKKALTALDVLDFLGQIQNEWPSYRRNFVAIVAIKNNHYRWWAVPSARGWCTSRVQYIGDEFTAHMRNHSVKFPDVLYIMNGYDKPLCPAGNCSAPIFSFDKSWDAATGSSAHDDILFPVLNHPFDTLISYPWEKKNPKAFLRAGVYAAMAPNCSRVELYRMAQTVRGRQLLDMGIYKNRHWKVKVKTSPPVPMEHHSKWKFMINTDGQAASWRLAKLLAINSPVLKWQSDSIEYYYRSLKAGTHYIDVNATTILNEIERLQGAEHDAFLKQIAANAQEFAYRYLSQYSRVVYAKTELERYRELFAPGEMDKLLDYALNQVDSATSTSHDDATASKCEDQRLSIDDLLQLRRQLLAEK